MKKSILLAISALLAVPMGLSAKMKMVKEVKKESFLSNSAKEIDVDTKAGDIKITGHKQNRVDVVATKMAPEKEMKFVEVELEEETNDFEFESKFKKRSLIRNGARVDFDIKAPENMRLDDVRTYKGSILIQGMTNKIQEVYAEGGSVNIKDAMDSVQVKGNATKIRLTQKSLPKNAKIKLITKEGDITILLPKNVVANIDAKSTAGTVTSAFELKKMEEHHVKGKTGEGDKFPKVFLRTQTGNIKIETF